MKPVRIATIDGDQSVLYFLKNTIEGKVAENLGIKINVETYQEPPENTSVLKGVSATFIDSNVGGISGKRIGEELKESGYGGKRVLMSSELKEYLGAVIKRGFLRNDIDVQKFNSWLNEQSEVFSGFLSKPIPMKIIQGIISTFKKDSHLYSPQNPGIVGLGQLGKGTIDKLVAPSWVERIIVQSDYANGDVNEIENALSPLDLTGEQRDKIVICSSFEKLLEENPDEIYFTTGEHNFPYGDYTSRYQLKRRLFRETMPKIDRFGEIILANGFKNPLIVQSNPQGEIMYVLKERGIEPYAISGFPPDTVRFQSFLLDMLRINNPDFNPEDIELTVIGEHGKEIPLLTDCRVRTAPLTLIYPEYHDPKVRKKSTRKGREKALEMMKVAHITAFNYRGVPERNRECQERIAHLDSEMPYSIYSYDKKEDAFISVPTNVSYYPLRFRPKTQLEELTQDQYVLEEVRAQNNSQRRMAQAYLKKNPTPPRK